MSNPLPRLVATEQRLLKRSCESLIGITAGMLADGHLSNEEISFLSVWLTENEALRSTWPGEVVHARVREALSDGTISEQEREYLKNTLSELIGGSIADTGAAFGLSTTLPLDVVDAITIAERNFCFTGAFLFGTRAACERAIAERQGTSLPGIRKDLNYLVIGTLASREWAHTSHGRKIEKAISYKKSGLPLLIVSEEQWVRAL